MKSKKHIIYMAAGNSRRFGENKLLSHYRGKALYRHGLDMLIGAVGDREDVELTVVSQYREILDYAEEHGLRAVDSPGSREGVSYTIKAGIGSPENIEDGDCLIFVVADQPLLSAGTIGKFLDFADDEAYADCNAAAAYGEQNGNPVLFRARMLPRLLALQGDEGGGKALIDSPCHRIFTDTAGELQDIDVKEDLRSF